MYASYCAGETTAQRGPWWSGLDCLFGVAQELTYGLNDPVEDETVEITFVEPLGPLPEGATLRFRAAGNREARAFLPVRALDGADVVARDSHGRPAIVVKRHGSGRAVLCTYPLEYFAARLGRVNPEDTWRLYDALAELAGVRRPAHVEDPRVLADVLVDDDGGELVVVLSQHDEPVERTVIHADGRRTAVRLPGLGATILHRR